MLASCCHAKLSILQERLHVAACGGYGSYARAGPARAGWGPGTGPWSAAKKKNPDRLTRRPGQVGPRGFRETKRAKLKPDRSGLLESQSVSNLKPGFGPKGFTARFEPNGFGEPKRDLIRVLGRQGALNSKPRFGPKGFGEPKRVKLLTPDSVQRLL